MENLINRFNKDYPNGSIQVQRIMMEIPEKGEVSKATIQPDVNNSQRFFTWYGEGKTVEEAQLNAIKFALSYLYS